MTIPTFDIFKVEADGGVLWRESATTVDQAKQRARELAATAPGEYFILSHRTGNKLKVESDAPAASKSPFSGGQTA
ncbi:MAG TPA: hypothetical protein VHX36_06295 [Candidatus Acidoferrales bacterium]|jgi:sarcosine oxidase gamma subunit|nr:hypothetical protein [Candidatus Acidoferrales bacterium]